MALLSTRCAFISAYLKGEEANLITSDHMGRMSNARTIQEVLEIIGDTDIGSYLEGTFIKTFDDADEYLWRYFSGSIQHLESFRFLPSDISRILRAYIVKYDVANTKAALRGISTHKKGRMIPVGIIHTCGSLDELFGAESLDDICQTLAKCKLGDYANILKEQEKRIDGGLKSRLLTESRLDSKYYESLLTMTEDVRDGFVLSKAFGLIIGLVNLQIICRAIIDGMGPEAAEFPIPGGYMMPGEFVKELLSLKLGEIPGRLEGTQYQEVAEEVSNGYARTKSITVVEEVIEKHRFRLVKEILSPRVLSPLVLAWWLILKEVEMRNLRLIIKAMADNIPLEEIEDYLVLPS